MAMIIQKYLTRDKKYLEIILFFLFWQELIGHKYLHCTCTFCTGGGGGG